LQKILVIDDQAEIRDFLRVFLAREGYEPVTVPGAAQGIERARDEAFSLVLLDLGLSDEPGLSALKKIKAAKPGLPVLIYSGLVTPQLEIEARAAGASDVLAKNAGIGVLAAQIKKFLEATEGPGGRSRHRKEKRILIVDDEASVRTMLARYFAGKGYATVEAGTGEEALIAVAREEVSVALLDIQLPGMDGLETLARLLELRPSLGVVMATGMQSDERVRKALEMGAYGYVLKPFDFLYLDLVVMSRLSLAQG
jgi:DNA-binding response OmpR family regulator